MDGYEKGSEHTYEQWKKKLWDDFDKHCSGKKKCNKNCVTKLLSKCEKKWKDGNRTFKSEWQNHFNKFAKSVKTKN
ncbi:hypothetical protein POVWA2_079020 [Plasmodium ovale wallikeri]|uniref:Uncharacterized protein n=1 Tax=Plasmodium ovale wallikeri TaxID=864142 RepID=A0A1A9AQ02_PLAOA|nr:hypothetical protein POVWA2_079020 [Plasmodium ovale wallikeri]SBT58290.1 hypothetical protein POVWA1_086850 [Plasmodium ovale wallikeri]